MTTTANATLRNLAPEWPTIGLIALVNVVIGILVWWHAVLPWWLIMPIGAYAAALHSSLQHEVLHGHPTRSRAINEWLVVFSPNMWLPYGRYRDTHLQHHNDAFLTDPDKDPESYYLLPEVWARMPGLKRALFITNQTLAGRMIVGPAVSIVRFWHAEWRRMMRGDFSALSCWLKYFFACAVVVFLVTRVAGMPLWQYVLLIAYPAISLALVRSYCEHQAAEDIGERTIIVEASPFWSVLFLYNNLHVAHHSAPGLPWYKLPAYYEEERERLIAKNHGYCMRGYGEIFRRFFLKPKEPVPYPDVSWLKQ